MHINIHRIKQAVFAAVSETFEAMIFTQIAPAEMLDTSFLFPEPAESDRGNHDLDSPETESCLPIFYQTEIRLETPQNASFSMIFPSGLAINITKNLYGWMEENDPPEHLIQDSLSEIINTVAGKLMTILLDNQSTFSLSLPELRIVSRPSMKKGDVYAYQTENNDTFILVIDGELLSEK